MSFALSAVTRTTVGKRVQNIRMDGDLPAVMYGRGIPSKALQLKASEFQKVYRGAGSSSLIDVTVDGTQPVKALIQEVQVHPLTLKPFHIDFRQIRMDEVLTVPVPLVFAGEAPAVKELAGTLIKAIDEIMVRCLPIDLPHEIRVDLSSLKTFEQAITIKDLQLPKGVQVVDQEESMMIATVAPPLTEEQLKKMEEQGSADVTAVKTEAEEKRAQEEAKKAEEAAAEEATK